MITPDQQRALARLSLVADRVGAHDNDVVRVNTADLRVLFDLYEAASRSATLANAFEMTGCRDEAGLIDMATVGRDLLDVISSFTKPGAQLAGWRPADSPVEIVTDLANLLADALASPPPAAGPTLLQINAAFDALFEKSLDVGRDAIIRDCRNAVAALFNGAGR